MELVDLRVGNLVGVEPHPLSPLKVLSIIGHNPRSKQVVLEDQKLYPIKQIVPLELDETWRKKLGFQTYSHLDILDLTPGLSLTYNISTKHWFYSIHSLNTVWTRDFTHVHEIQNLYQSVKGKELKLKDTTEDE